jgi:hypothetical protein
MTTWCSSPDIRSSTDDQRGDTPPLNGVTLDRGYTIEAFLKLPTDFGDDHAWCGVLTRMGTGGDAGKTGDDPSEPVATLNLDGGGTAQWAVFPRRDEWSTTVRVR